MTRLRNRLPPIEGFAAAWRRIVRAVVGDRVGATLFVGACLLYGTIWQVGFLLNDTWTISNTLVGVLDGHLYVDRVVYGSYAGLTPGDSPGMHVVGQRLYGRNYGQVFFAVPFVWALQGLSVLADPRILLAAIWSLGVVLLSGQVGHLAGRYRSVLTGGCLLALLAFAANVWLATPLAERWIPHLGLQLSTIVAGGLLVALLYRLIELATTKRTAVVFAAAAAIGTPVAFWAAAPKRHTMSALLVLATVYSFARSRDATDRTSARRFRALAYVWVGLLTWVHAAEGLTVLVGLGAADVLTARRNTPRELATVAVVFLVSLLPFFVTNALVVGDPLLPGRLWPTFDGNQPAIINGEVVGATEPSGGESGGSGPNGGGASNPSGGSTPNPSIAESILGILSPALSTLTGGIDRLASRMDRSLSIVLDDPDRLYRTFVRSGWSPAQAQDQQAINMTMLETVPLLGSLLALPALANRGPLSRPTRWSTRRQTDVLVVLVSVTLLFLYLPSLPLHASLTVRYLHPMIPLLVYGIARIPAWQGVLNDRLRIVGWSCTAGIVLGGQLVIAGLALFTSSIGEAVQLHGLLNLGFAGGLGLWTLAFTAGVDRDRSLTIGAILFGVTVGISTVTMLFLSWNHLTYGEPVLGIGRLFRLVIPP